DTTVSMAIKICGITRPEDAEAAIASGATHIGMIFVGNSPRLVEPNQAIAISQLINRRAQLVGVFKDNTPESIVNLHSILNFDFIQYHGTESPEFIQALSLPAIKSFDIDQSFSWDSVTKYQHVVDFVLLDRPKSGAPDNWLDKALEVASSAPEDLPPF